MDGSGKAARSLVVARGDGAVLFEPREEVFDQVAVLVEVPVRLAGFGGGRSRGDHDRLSRRLDSLHHSFEGVIARVGDDRLRALEQTGQQRVGPFEVRCLSAGQMEGERIAQGVARRVDLRAQSSPASPETLRCGVPLFAPAACWWARTMVESIMAYSLSGSAESFSKTRSQTPDSAHRE